MDLFEKQAQLQSLFQTSPVDAAYAQGTVTGRRIAGTYQDLDIALLLLQRVNASEFFDYQVYCRERAFQDARDRRSRRS